MTRKRAKPGTDEESDDKIEKTAFLVTKTIVISIDEFGDLEEAYPDCDEPEEYAKEQIEQNISEQVICCTYEKAFNKAKEFFVDAKQYVNCLGYEENGKGKKPRDTDLDYTKYVVDPYLIENEVIYDAPFEDEDEDIECNVVSAKIKIVIKEMPLI